MTKLLLIAMAVAEASTGIALLVAPSFVAWLLLGEGLSSRQSLELVRIMGAALLSIGVACWQERNRNPSETRSIVTSMLLYNVVVPVILAYAVFGDGLRGLALWPACVVHLVLAIGCFRCLWRD